MKRAYLSIEGNIVKAVILKKDIENAEFSEFDRQELLTFIKDNSIEEIYLTVSFSELYTFKFSLPFQISKKKKFLEQLIINEIRKRYSIQQFSFIYAVNKLMASSWIRCYMVPEDSYQFINEFILQKLNIKALYPMHIPLTAFIKYHADLEEKNKIICFFSGKTRFLFVFEKSEMIFMRDFEGEEDLTEEDTININMTVNYAIQNFRVTPQEIVFIGAKNKELSGLILPYRFLSVLPETEKFTVPLSMILFGEDLKHKNILPKEYRRFKKTIKSLKYVSFIFIIIALILFGHNAVSLNKLKSLYSSMTSHRQYILQNDQYLMNIQQSIKKLETEFRSFIELHNKRNSLIDTRYLLINIAQAKTELIQLISIEILNSERPEIKIKGRSTGKSFSERQLSFLNFKSFLSQKGFKIISENLDITKGELSINAVYEHPGILQ